MTKPHWTRWTETELSILCEEYPTLGPIHCATRLDKTISAIATKATRLGLKSAARYARHIHMERLKSPAFAYILGYLWADGCVNKKGHQTRLGPLSLHDAKILIPILEQTGDWKAFERVINGITYMGFFVNDRWFCDVLKETGYATKSHRPFDLICKRLGSDLVPYFVHGFFDGDGSMVWFSNGRRAASFAGRHDYDWTYLRSLLNEAGIAVNKPAISYVKRRASSSALTIQPRADLLRFYRLFVRHEGVGLPRKKTRFEAFVGEIQQIVAKRRKVEVCPSTGRFTPKARLNGKTIHMGRFVTLQEAELATDQWDEKNQTERHRLKCELALLDPIHG